MEGSASFYRARLMAIDKLVESLPVLRDEKNPERTLVRNGHIPDSVKPQYEKLLSDEYLLTFSLNEPLTFKEITGYNTWFEMHPEKVCGKEIVTSSREFPLSVKGTEQDIISAISGQNENSQVLPEENETTLNKFGNPSDILQMTVSGFEQHYFEQFEAMQELLKPLEEKAIEIKSQIKEACKDRNKKKELQAELEKIINENSRIQSEFDQDYQDYITGFYLVLSKMATGKGLKFSEDEGNCFADEVLMTITERPGTEHYWQVQISEVAAEVLSYFLENKPQTQDLSELEIEALALQVQLELLKL